MLENLMTEKRNPKTQNLDQMTPGEFLRIMNEEDGKVAEAVKETLPDVEEAVKTIIKNLKKGGRLIYMGAGTSGRLGVLDAVECSPTFGTTDEVQGIIAGGESAFIKAIEGAEDSKELAEKELKELNIRNNDIIVGIAASGRTPYVIGGLEYAHGIGAATVAVSCNKNAEISKYADVAIEVDCGPEVLTGSTRLKAGSAQKMILNMISTASMVGVGKVYGNLMVDVRATNEKLVERAKRIVMEATGASYEEAEKTLVAAKWHVKTAIVMILAGCGYEEAVQRLEKAEGFVREAIK
ncbi:N-acetylmuramic acid 6-phosphate etherase [Sebaldella sp. S0638]|uniref:N-acetylmuramic acid 6-phosphate etherase n=1 Tax=Sebaldella sp. S0638 TaxID=2957809 RepID=UPI00209D380D|nr:N-acetylmuramic acid 6-phosphate etherase [Sebaldella sp. S0638]MCP1225633.1 N-acetylmuramic acid 6-phosphate etherase [Sebaldella sp. S0638]